MAKNELLGLMDCPECGMSGAEVRNDKSGKAYRFCPDCTAQYFTRGGEKEKKLLEKLNRPHNAVAVNDETAVKQPAAPSLKKMAFDMAGL